jgi:hypothetical protein
MCHLANRRWTCITPPPLWRQQEEGDGSTRDTKIVITVAPAQIMDAAQRFGLVTIETNRVHMERPGLQAQAGRTVAEEVAEAESQYRVKLEAGDDDDSESTNLSRSDVENMQYELESEKYYYSCDDEDVSGIGE